jgi:hypothetical protein
VGAYTNIKVNGPFNVTLVSGDAGTLTLKAEKGMLALVTTEVIDGTLTIALAEGQALPDKKQVKVRVPFTAMGQIDLVGSGCIDVEKTLKTDVKLTVDGCGTISLKAYNTNVEAWILGPGKIVAKGSATNFTGKIIGAGSINASGLEAQNVTALISGSGDIQADCTKAIVGRINGNGSITCTGKPAQKDLKRSGSGEFTML